MCSIYFYYQQFHDTCVNAVQDVLRHVILLPPSIQYLYVWYESNANNPQLASVLNSINSYAIKTTAVRIHRTFVFSFFFYSLYFNQSNTKKF